MKVKKETTFQLFLNQFRKTLQCCVVIVMTFSFFLVSLPCGVAFGFWGSSSHSLVDGYSKAITGADATVPLEFGDFLKMYHKDVYDAINSNTPPSKETILELYEFWKKEVSHCKVADNAPIQSQKYLLYVDAVKTGIVNSFLPIRESTLGNYIDYDRDTSKAEAYRDKLIEEGYTTDDVVAVMWIEQITNGVVEILTIPLYVGKVGKLLKGKAILKLPKILKNLRWLGISMATMTGFVAFTRSEEFPLKKNFPFVKFGVLKNTFWDSDVHFIKKSVLLDLFVTAVLVGEYVFLGRADEGLKFGQKILINGSFGYVGTRVAQNIAGEEDPARTIFDTCIIALFSTPRAEWITQKLIKWESIKVPMLKMDALRLGNEAFGNLMYILATPKIKWWKGNIVNFLFGKDEIEEERNLEGDLICDDDSADDDGDMSPEDSEEGSDSYDGTDADD